MPEYRGSLPFRTNTKQGLMVKKIVKRITEEERLKYATIHYKQYDGLSRDEIIRLTYGIKK